MITLTRFARHALSTAALGLALALTSCGEPPITVTVKNTSPLELQDIELSGGEDSWKLDVPNVTAGEAVTVHPEFEGKSGLHLAFTARGKRHKGPDMGPLDGATKTELRITVGDDLSIRRR